MSADRELLELAAKAIGYDVWFDEDGVPIGWDPLLCDGDALRLATKLSLSIVFDYCADDAPIVGAGYIHFRDKWEMLADWPDSGAATRRAIVRAAAKIGRSVLRTEGGE